MEEKKLKEKEYLNYINGHIMNIRTAYIKYSEKLCKALNISERELMCNVTIHDQSKYFEEEFEGYRQYFYPCSNEKKDEKIFNDAWEHHYNINKHHPEFWVNEYTNEPEDMPIIYIAEMLLDWEAMSMKFGDNTYEYYMKNRDKKPFSDNTKKIIDSVIDIFKKE